jgi:hypothetical protein
VAVVSALFVALLGLVPVATATAAPSPAPALTGTHTTRFGIENPGKQAALRALEGEPCDTTPLDVYVGELFAQMTDEEFAFLVEHFDTLLNVPTYAPLLFGTSDDPRYALTLHVQQLTKTFRQVKRFWDIKSDDIQLMAMHGDVLTDAPLIAATLTLADEDDTPQADIQEEASEVATFMQAHPTFVDNPLWTLNAYAFSGVVEDPPFNAIPDKLVFGDGFIEAFDSLGLGDVGPRVVMGHEFGHHIQYEESLFDTDPELPEPEATRRTELMADTFAAYFGAHKKGLALNGKRIAQALEAGFDSGDCYLDDPGHHGTPRQRERAYEFGAGLAALSKPKASVLPSRTVAELFEDELPDILTPPAP